MGSHTVKLDSRTEKFLTLHLFTNVKNTKEIKQKIISGKLECCILKASMIIDQFQVIVAANKAALREFSGNLITKSVFTEILYAISCSKNISQSLTKFGIHDNDTNIIIALLHRKDERNNLEETILNQIKGEKISISRLKEFSDINCIRKTYQVDHDEIQVSSLEDSIVGRIGSDYPVHLK